MRIATITVLFAVLAVLNSCTPSGSLNVISVGSDGPPDTVFTIHDSSGLIGGPLATGRIGDVLLENDKIRLVIEQPGKVPWVGNFGGTIIDADLVRNVSKGQDNFGFMQPLINIEWTLNAYDFEVIDTGEESGKKVFRTYSVIDVYDYLDLDFIAAVALDVVGLNIYYAPRFDDVYDPFNLTELRDLNRHVVTDYTLGDGKNYVKIETAFENMGDEEIFVPVGDFVNGSGEVMFLIPGLGFTPDVQSQIQGDTPALIYVGFEDTDVSYGYFYDMEQFVIENEEGVRERLKTTSASYSGVTGVILGDDLLKILPFGSTTEPEMNFSIPAHGARTLTRYFAVGDGSGGSVFDVGLSVLGIETKSVSGVVTDASGDPVDSATVAVKNVSDATIITYRTDSKGRFSGYLSTGASAIDKAFGDGRYKLSVYKKGYGEIEEPSRSGSCDPEEIDLTRGAAAGITCRLGSSGIVRISGGVVDEETGEKIPARLTVVGYAPGFSSESGGQFEDKIIFERPLGVVDVYYINARGTVGIEERDAIRLAPGRYELVFTRGVEYSMERIPVDIAGDGVTSVGPVGLKKVVDTTGFISADFHLHSIVSPDSAMRPERRVLAAAGEGMDVLQSSDHDFLIDYGPHVKKLGAAGIINPDKMVTVVGDEISPNHIGHANIFPLEEDPAKPCGGALDWGYTESDIAGPEPDLVMSPQEVLDYVRGLPGEHVFQINHIADRATSLLVLGGWVTVPSYYESFGVEPLSSYADPVHNRLRPEINAAYSPYPYGSSEMVVTDIDAIELIVGPQLHDDFLLTSSLPQWFNLLNLGIIVTATADSDSHREIAEPVGAPRNFVVSGTDPADGLGSFAGFDRDEYANAIRNQKVIVTTGPFVRTSVKNAGGSVASVGGTVIGSDISLTIDVTSPEWAWFDTIEIYANTETVPASDEDYLPLEGKAADPSEFFEPYHVPRFHYEPAYTFSLSDGSLEGWRKEGGVIKAHVELDMELEDDTWIVVFVKGTEGTEGYRSLFPFVTRALIDADNPSAPPEEADFENIDVLSVTGAPAWAFTNPLFVDVDGDDFEPIYVNWGFGGAKYQAVRGAANISATGVNSQLLQ